MRGQKGYPRGKGSLWRRRRRKAHPTHPLTLAHGCFATPAMFTLDVFEPGNVGPKSSLVLNPIGVWGL